MKRVTSLLINNVISRIFAISIKDFYYYPVVLYYKTVKRVTKVYKKKRKIKQWKLNNIKPRNKSIKQSQ